MRILDRYIGRHILFGTLAAMAILMTLLGVLTLFDELGSVGKGRYTTSDAFLVVLLGLPRYAYELFPATVLLGSLAGLGALASHSELTAMRAAGVSLERIIVAVMKTGFIMMLVVALLGEVVAPPSEQYAREMRSALIENRIAMQSKYGFWARDDLAFINIRNIQPGGVLEDIYIYEFNEKRELKVSTYAEYAQYQGGKWHMNGISQTYITNDGTRVKNYKQASWKSLIDPDLLNVVVVKPNLLPIWGLYRYIQYLKENGQDANKYEVAFWSKVFSPIVTLAMAFLAVPFLFGGLRSVTIGQRIFVGSMIGISFFLLNRAIAYMAVVYDLNALMAAAFPGFLITVLAIWSMRRVH